MIFKGKNEVKNKSKFSPVIPFSLVLRKAIEKYIFPKYLLKIYFVAGYSIMIFLSLSLRYKYSWRLFFVSLGLYFVYKEIISDLVTFKK